MPSIRDVVAAIRQRDGVEAVVVLGRDGVVIDSDTASAIDADRVAAFVPAVLQAAEALAATAELGALGTAVLEHDHGFAVIAGLSADAILLVFVQPTTELGALLYELRRNRAGLSALV